MKYFYLEQNKKSVKVTIGIEGSELSYSQTYNDSDNCNDYSSSNYDSDDCVKKTLKDAAEKDKKRRPNKRLKM